MIVLQDLEYHPFEDFVPKNSKYLILGSFPPKELTQNLECIEKFWFYSSKKNQFWKILERIYQISLPTKEEKKALLKYLKIGIGDIFSKCKRKNKNSSDENLLPLEYNKNIQKILSNFSIEKIYVSSRFVEKHLKKNFYIFESQIIYLPSPSPRFARYTLEKKIEIYQNLLPKIERIFN